MGGDYLVQPSRTQTAGLTDGEFYSAEGFGAGAQVTYTLTALSLQAGYQYTYGKTVWNGPAERDTGAALTSFRKDTTHIISVGLGKAF